MVDITTEVTIDTEQLQNALAGDHEQAMEFILLLDEAVADYGFTLRLFNNLGEALAAEINASGGEAHLVRDDLNTLVENLRNFTDES